MALRNASTTEDDFARYLTARALEEPDLLVSMVDALVELYRTPGWILRRMASNETQPSGLRPGPRLTPRQPATALPGIAARHTRAQQHLENATELYNALAASGWRRTRNAAMRGLGGSPTVHAGPVGPNTSARDFSNLLAVVVELDAAVSASAAGDKSAVIEHIEAAKENVLEDARPVRVSVAARMLGLSRRTVDAWADAGLLTLVEEPGTTVKTIDPRRLYEVKILVDDLRAAGRKRGLAEAVWHRLQDRELTESPELHESIAQMQRGETISLEQFLAEDSEDEESGDSR